MYDLPNVTNIKQKRLPLNVIAFKNITLYSYLIHPKTKPTP